MKFGIVSEWNRDSRLESLHNIWNHPGLLAKPMSFPHPRSCPAYASYDSPRILPETRVKEFATGKNCIRIAASNLWPRSPPDTKRWSFMHWWIHDAVVAVAMSRTYSSELVMLATSEANVLVSMLYHAPKKHVYRFQTRQLPSPIVYFPTIHINRWFHCDGHLSKNGWIWIIKGTISSRSTGHGIRVIGLD